LTLLPLAGTATEIPGILPVAYDQPQIYGALVRSGDTPLVQELLGDAYFKAFLDTGASGIVLDPFYAGELGFNLTPYQYNGTGVVFSDVAVGGSVDYQVSEPLELRLAAYQPYELVNDVGIFTTVYNQRSGPARLQLGPIGSTGEINVIGMPAMVGKVLVVDPKPMDGVLLGLSAAFDQLHSYVYHPGTPYFADTSYTDPGIPATDRHIRLTMVDVSRFTATSPAGAEAPALARNPFIGPNPLNAIDGSVPAGSTPGITITRGELNATGSFLFDTGAAFSFISEAMAAQLQVRYRAGTFGTAAPVLESFDPANPGLEGTALTQTIQYDVSGIGGAVTVAGFYLDALLVRTTEGDPANPDDPAHLRYTHTPVIVYDVAVKDPTNNDELVLDGVFGMNMLVASALVEFIIPGFPVIADVRLAPFDWLVFDEPNALLGVNIGRSIDDDADDDGVRDAVDICPVDADPGQLDTDFDLAGDACDDLPNNSSENLDTDSDGTGDNEDPDDDGDGVNDGIDVCPLVADPGQGNYDGDSFGDACDYDDDNDGVDDPRDAFALEFAASKDADADGWPDAWNPGCDVTCQNASGLVLDDDPSAASCPELICRPFNRGWRVIFGTGGP
jgi:hypothetical protein